VATRFRGVPGEHLQRQLPATPFSLGRARSRDPRSLPRPAVSARTSRPAPPQQVAKVKPIAYELPRDLGLPLRPTIPSRLNGCHADSPTPLHSLRSDIARAGLPDCHENVRVDGRHRGFRDERNSEAPRAQAGARPLHRYARPRCVSEARGAGLAHCARRDSPGRLQGSLPHPWGRSTLLAGGRRSCNSSLPGVSIAPAECPRERLEDRVGVNRTSTSSMSVLIPSAVRRWLRRTS
jgi:hypothetical protein